MSDERDEEGIVSPGLLDSPPNRELVAAGAQNDVSHGGGEGKSDLAPPNRGEINALLSAYNVVLIPNAVSSHSWNLLFVASLPAGAYTVRSQDRFALDTRLHPPPP